MKKSHFTVPLKDLSERLSADLKDLKEALLSKEQEGLEDNKNLDQDAPDGDDQRVQMDWTAQVDGSPAGQWEEAKTAFWRDVIRNYLEPQLRTQALG